MHVLPLQTGAVIVPCLAIGWRLAVGPESSVLADSGRPRADSRAVDSLASQQSIINS
jgi:hypothetical protein